MTDHKLDEFVQKLKAAAADNLKAVILYGSAATEEFHAKHSDLNILCLVGQAEPRVSKPCTALCNGGSAAASARRWYSRWKSCAGPPIFSRSS